MFKSAKLEETFKFTCCFIFILEILEDRRDRMFVNFIYNFEMNCCILEGNRTSTSTHIGIEVNSS